VTPQDKIKELAGINVLQCKLLFMKKVRMKLCANKIFLLLVQRDQMVEISSKVGLA